MKLEDISIIKSEINQARELIKKSKDLGCLVLSGRFEHFGTAIDFHLNQLQKQDTSQQKLDDILYFQDLRENRKYISDDLGNILIILFRLIWTKGLASAKTCPDGLWREFTSLDIKLFFVEFRSIFDYVANLITRTADKPGEIGQNWSFRELSNKIDTKKEDDKARKKATKIQRCLGVKQTGLVQKGQWYSEIRRIRDNLAHRGSETIVFGTPKDPILFQLYSGPPYGAIDISLFQWDEKNIVDFELLSAYYLAKLLLYLEELGSYLYQKVPVSEPFDRISKSTVYRSIGLPILMEFFNKLSNKLEQT